MEQMNYKNMQRLKAQYGDVLLFVRVGDFYEVFGDDAVTAAKALDLTLTGRDMQGAAARVPMAGVPYHALDGILAKLVEKGYKVAIAESTYERCEAPAAARITQETKTIKERNTMTNADRRDDPLYGDGAEDTEQASHAGGAELPAKPVPGDYVRQADAAFARAVRGGRYPDIVNAIADLDYSVRNVMLIKRQLPAATDVRNMKMWNYRRRSIVPNSKAIKILAPQFDNGDGHTGNAEKDKTAKAVGYKINHVFDISQTSGEALRGTRCDTAFLDTHYEGVKNTIAAAVGAYAFTEGAKAVSVDFANKTASIKEGLSREDVLKSMIYCVARIRVEGRERETGAEVSPGRAIFDELKETAIAHIVSRRLGLGGVRLKTIDFSQFDDESLVGLAGDLNRVKAIAHNIVDRVENYVAEVRTAERLQAEGDDEDGDESGAFDDDELVAPPVRQRAFSAGAM